MMADAPPYSGLPAGAGGPPPKEFVSVFLRIACTQSYRKENAMKLNSAMIQRTLGQFEADAIPTSHPSLPQLNKIFGEHTFLVNNRGLHIVEPTGTSGRGETTAQVIKLASWDKDVLRPHEPTATDVTVVLEPKKPASEG
jgi:hypothetical protein